MIRHIIVFIVPAGMRRIVRRWTCRIDDFTRHAAICVHARYSADGPRFSVAFVGDDHVVLHEYENVKQFELPATF